MLFGVWDKRLNLSVRVKRKFKIVLFRKITVSKLYFSGLWLLFECWRCWIVGDFHFLLCILLWCLRIDIFIGQAVAVDDIIHVVAEVTFLTSDYHVHKFINENRYFDLNQFGDWNCDLVVDFLSLTELFRICDFRLWNEALKVAYLADDTLFLFLYIWDVVLVRIAPGVLLNGKWVKVAGEGSIVSFEIVLLKFGLQNIPSFPHSWGILVQTLLNSFD